MSEKPPQDHHRVCPRCGTRFPLGELCPECYGWKRPDKPA